MADEIVKKIKFVADLSSLKESMREIIPMMQAVEGQMKMTATTGAPSLLNQYGMPYQQGGGAPNMGANMSTSMSDLKSSPAYQLLASERALRTKTDDLQGDSSGRSITDIIQEKINQGSMGGMGRLKTQSLTDLVERSKKLDSEFEKTIKTIKSFNDGLESVSFKDAVLAKKGQLDITKQREMMLSQVGGVPGGGPGGMFGGIGSSIAGIASIVGIQGVTKALQMAVQIPMERLTSRAAVAQVAARDVGAVTNITDFASMMRLNPELRESAQATGAGPGRIGSYLKAGGVGAGIGGGVGAGLGLLGGPFAGLTVPLGAGIGTAVGGGMGTAYNYMTGGGERGAARGFEEAMQLQIQEKGVVGQTFRNAVQMRGMLRPFQRTFGMGEEDMMNTMTFNGGLGNSSNMLNVAKDLKLEPAELLRGMTGMGGLQGGTDLFGEDFFGGANLTRQMGKIARGTGVSAQNVTEMAVGLGGGEMGGAGDNMKRLEDIMARGTARGYDNSILAQRNAEAVINMSQQFGAGFGAAGINAAEVYTGVMTDVMGAQAVTPQASASFGAQMETFQKGSGGLGQYAAYISAEDASKNLKGKMKNPSNYGRFVRMLARSSPSELADPKTRRRLQNMVGLDDASMNDIVRRRVQNQITNVATLMPGEGTNEEKLFEYQQITNKSTVGAERFASGIDGFMRRTGNEQLTSPSAGEAERGKDIQGGTANVMANTLTARLLTVGSIQAMELGLSRTGTSAITQATRYGEGTDINELLVKNADAFKQSINSNIVAIGDSQRAYEKNKLFMETYNDFLQEQVIERYGLSVKDKTNQDSVEGNGGQGEE